MAATVTMISPTSLLALRTLDARRAAEAETPIVTPGFYGKLGGTYSEPSVYRASEPAPEPAAAEQQVTPPRGSTSSQPPLLPKDAPIPAHYLKSGQQTEPWSGFIRGAGYSDGVPRSIWDSRWSPPRGW